MEGNRGAAGAPRSLGPWICCEARFRPHRSSAAFKSSRFADLAEVGASIDVASDVIARFSFQKKPGDRFIKAERRLAKPKYYVGEG